MEFSTAMKFAGEVAKIHAMKIIHPYRKFGKLDTPKQISTILKTLLCAAAIGIIAGLLWNPLTGIILAGVVSLGAFSFFGNKALNDQNDENCKRIIKEYHNNIFESHL